ncbi:Schwannomin-interacting protein 1 [Labeo rohita]|uniref:Schwannomin-interacting protein 1 n=1 Tax=Labeo rohita TaxID=84645 RepID=A0ABQ8M129_LABRO|nr:Schwannomin-interacting protein 1 [Labeo rohita]
MALSSVDTHGMTPDQTPAPSLGKELTDYREDGMDLGSDSSSRSSSESNSNKVTPCSEYKSSPSLELAGLEDYEEDEDYQQYKKRALVDWERDYGGSYADNQHQDFRQTSPLHGAVNGRSLAEELQSAKAPAGPLAGHAAASVPEELKQNGNSIPPCAGKTLGKRGLGSGGTGREAGRGVGLGSYREEYVEESQLPPMDWAALERHLAGLQFREQQNHNHGLIRTNSTNVSPHECLMLLESVFVPIYQMSKRLLVCHV